MLPIAVLHFYTTETQVRLLRCLKQDAELKFFPNISAPAVHKQRLTEIQKPFFRSFREFVCSFLYYRGLLCPSMYRMQMCQPCKLFDQKSKKKQVNKRTNATRLLSVIARSKQSICNSAVTLPTISKNMATTKTARQFLFWKQQKGILHIAEIL